MKKADCFTTETVSAVSAIVDEAARMRNAYFFSPASNAGGRRSYERQHSHDEVRWTENGFDFSASYTVSCSCNNVYASGEYTRDGERTTLTAIKASLKRMTATLASAN